MKLGEALTLRARSAQKLGDLQQRIVSNTTVQEGEDPAEDALELIERYKAASTEFSKLVLDIQLTNAQTTDSDGVTLAGLMQERENLRRQRNVLRTAASHVGGPQYRYSRTEIKIVPTLDAKELQSEIEKIETRIQAIDTKLQSINWSTDLIVS